MTEAEYMVGEPIDSLYTDAMANRMLRQGSCAEPAIWPEALVAEPSTLYGLGCDTDGRQMHFIFDLTRKITRGKGFGASMMLWGDGSKGHNIREFAESIAESSVTLPSRSTTTRYVPICGRKVKESQCG